ncbi:hypothetical protein AGMMS49921_01490 [Endomicrobiia bacterium]|nr:hypothetical protein AGMMS49921_01490 [Endomicrobiia bacterium]
MIQEKAKNNKELLDVNPIETISPIKHVNLDFYNAELNNENIRLFNAIPINALMGQKQLIDMNEKEQTIRMQLHDNCRLLVENFKDAKNLEKQLDSATINPLLVYLVARLTEQNHHKEKNKENLNRKIELSVKEYMECRGLKSYSKVKEQIKKDSHLLFSCWLDWHEEKPHYYCLKHKTRILAD